MSAAASSNWTTQAPCRSAAVLRGIGLVGVVKGFARGVLSLGLLMSGTIAWLKQEGGSPSSANAGFDFKAILGLLQRAVLLADALKARLRTPAVALALARFATGRARDAGKRAAPSELDDTLAQIAIARADERLRRQFRRAVAEMSDAEVLAHIYADLRHASAMLGDTEVATEVEALANKATALLAATNNAAPGDAGPSQAAPSQAAPSQAAPSQAAPSQAAPSDIAAETAAARPVAHARLGDRSDTERTPSAKPAVREVGRGPP